MRGRVRRRCSAVSGSASIARPACRCSSSWVIVIVLVLAFLPRPAFSQRAAATEADTKDHCPLTGWFGADVGGVLGRAANRPGSPPDRKLALPQPAIEESRLGQRGEHAHGALGQF